MSTYSSVFNSVCTRGIPRIHSGKVGRLYSAGPYVAVSEYAVTVRARDPVPPPSPHCGVAIAQPRLGPPEELISQLEIKVVADALGKSECLESFFELIGETIR